MKKHLLSIVLGFALCNAYAQDPQVSNPNVAPSPAKVQGPITISFTFQNESSVPITNPSPVNSPLVVRVTLNKVKPVMDQNGNITVAGAGAAYFNWAAECSGTCATDGSSDATDIWSVNGIQNSVIPGVTDPNETVGGPIIVSGTATAASTQADRNANNGNGFIVNLTPGAGGDIDISPASNSLSSYTYTDGALPVTLTSFTATKEGQTAQLKWTTTMETNSDRFEIERSLNGKNWDLIGMQKSRGESTALINYSFSDTKPQNGENLYRLKMIDKDATYAYSRIQSLTFASDLTTSFYPNPVAEKLIIKTDDFSLVKNVKIFDANGRTVYQSSATPSSEINVQNLSAGLYVVQMVSKSGVVISHKVVKQ